MQAKYSATLVANGNWCMLNVYIKRLSDTDMHVGVLVGMRLAQPATELDLTRRDYAMRDHTLLTHTVAFLSLKLRPIYV